jgi:hypothetical protein
MQMYPHWNARDNYRFGVKKKKRKREKSIEPGGGNSATNNSMKKCRARYGLELHNLWCKPCRYFELETKLVMDNFCVLLAPGLLGPRSEYYC